MSAKEIRRKIIPYSIRKKIVDHKKIRKIDIYQERGNCYDVEEENCKKVSVVIPNYNYEDFIEERIDSVVNQTYPIYEVIILDDASTDHSIEKIEQVMKKHKNISFKTIYNEKNSHSVFSQWQKGFREAKGDYVWIAEADDSCHPMFLESVMDGFSDDDVVISYTESLRMNEKNEVISESCRDWMEGVSTTRWNQSFVHSGEQEITEALSICNTIPNVSAVVFKKKNQLELIEEAKKFKVSGDWFLYYNLLKDGKLAYCSKSLNYFRKHSKSTSTVAKKEIELEEVLIIQKEIRDHYKLTTEQIRRQGMRYGTIMKEVEPSFLKEVESMMAKKIAWIIPHPIKGSGGIRTMIQNANFLAEQGFLCDIYVEEDYMNDSNTVKKRIIDYYGKCSCNVYVGIAMREEYDLVFATYSILTADYVYYMKNVRHKAYFIQDFEPWFEPMGGLYLEMERTYHYGLQGISIGKWLTYKISHEYGSPMTFFPFCADLSVYKKLKDVKKEKAICFIYQPEKARRCSKLGIQALLLVKHLRPDVKIYLYGSDIEASFDFEVENLHIIPIEECNELYNKCQVGLCISASNPSRIPFEMMASGLPVVDLYRENNLYDVPEDGVLLAESTPEAIATALIKILDDEKLQKKMGENGHKFMQDYPLERGYQDFLKAVNQVLEGKVIKGDKVEKIYTKEKITPSDEVLKVSDLIQPIPVAIKNTSSRMRFFVRCKRWVIRKLKGQR